ncbi:GNAT family N-acetyltransferase [Marinilactibacillus sp. XAAS-LB27]|uniref:GNAT family N-acetyltransferase n=1 Tax=Marinilactibacillus sp. XAAS-LB27 TaxID=3114538 RepID=UPI002E17533D|nr:GNAT family N-acetyltransferase [Marinilactibacillus sp. XAAS-LB27]
MIREARLTDIESICTLMGHLGYTSTYEQMTERFDKINGHPDYRTYLAEQDGLVAGMVGLIISHPYESDKDYIRVVALVVDPNYRKQGIAKNLLFKVEELARQLSIDKITLNSGKRSERQQAHEFYVHNRFEVKSLGFVKHIR